MAYKNIQLNTTGGGCISLRKNAREARMTLGEFVE